MRPFTGCAASLAAAPFDLVMFGIVIRLACASPLVWTAGCLSLDDARPATPQRPTLSSNAATTAPGTLEIEAGFSGEPSGSYVIPATLKYGAGASTEVFGTWIPWQRLRGITDDEAGIGDLFLGLRHRFVEQDGARPAVAIQPSVLLPVTDADRGLTDGEPGFLLAGMATWDGPDLAANAYYELDLLGKPEGPGLRAAHLPALDGAWKAGGGWTPFAEIAGFFVPDQDVEAGFGTLGLAWSPCPELVLDAGARAGIGDDAPDVLIFVGLTWNLGRPSISAERAGR